MLILALAVIVTEIIKGILRVNVVTETFEMLFSRRFQEIYTYGGKTKFKNNDNGRKCVIQKRCSAKHRFVKIEPRVKDPKIVSRR